MEEIFESRWRSIALPIVLTAIVIGAALGVALS